MANQMMLSTSERNNMGRERLLSCLSECGAEREPVVLLELQKAYFNKYDEYLNKAELRKFFSKGHIKQVFENFMPKDVGMATDVNATGSLFLKMKRSLPSALADSPKTAPLLAMPKNNEADRPNLVPLPEPAPSRKVLPISEKFAIPQPVVTSNQLRPPPNRKQVFSLTGGFGDDTAAADAPSSDGILEDFVPSWTGPKNGAGNSETSTLVAYDVGMETTVGKKERTTTVHKGTNAQRTKTRYNDDGWGNELESTNEAEESSELGDAALEDGYQQKEDEKMPPAAAGRVTTSDIGGGSLLEAKWAEERLERDALVSERLRNRKREQQQRVQHHRAAHDDDDDENGLETRARDVNSFGEKRKQHFGVFEREKAAVPRPRKPIYAGKARFHGAPPFAPNLMSSEDDEDEEETAAVAVDGEVKGTKKLDGQGGAAHHAEEDEEEDEDEEEEEEGPMIHMSRPDEAEAGHETTTPEELHDEETEQFYEQFAIGTSSNKLPKKGSKTFTTNERYKFVGLISTMMCMLQNINHHDLDKKLMSISPSGVYRDAFPTAADLLVFINNHCPNINAIKVSKDNVALLWSERSDELMSRLLLEVGKAIAKKGGSQEKQ
uniref:PH domain-containing protein n=1 Tax=Globodera pallida TaxID=36090 RepID=A0A183BPG5_GLOPA